MFKLNNIINIIEATARKVVNVLNSGIETTLREISLMEIALVTLKQNVVKAETIVKKLQGILN